MERNRLDVNLQWRRNAEGEDEGFKLIGKVISKTRVGLVTVRESVSAAWKVEGDLEVKMIGFNMFVFTFKEENEACRILKENPWVVRNYMLSLQKRKPFLSNNEIQISKCEFWIQFHNIPLEGQMRSNVELMAKLVGNVIEIENPEDRRFSNRSMCRARVEIDIDKPLVPGFSTPRPDHNLDDLWIQVRYEKLVRFCYNCGKLGHESKGCEEEAVEFMVNGNPKGYDAGLCAQAYRPSTAAQGSWSQGRTSEVKGTHGEGKFLDCWAVGMGARYGCRGKEKTLNISREEMKTKRSNQSEVLEREGGKYRMGPTQNILVSVNFAHADFSQNLGRVWCPRKEKEKPIELGAGWTFNEYNGINSLLRARKEKLQKNQARYWVELVEDDEERANTSDEIIPVKIQDIGELEQGIREVSLKRKLEEKEETPRVKRRKDYQQESPGSAGEKEKAITGLQLIEKSEGFNTFGYKYEGDFSFQMGRNSKQAIRNKKKTKRALFRNTTDPEGSNFALWAEAFDYGKGEGIHMEEPKESQPEGCGGWPEAATSEP